MAIRQVSGISDMRRCAPILVAAFNESPFPLRWTTKTAVERLKEVHKRGPDFCFVYERRDAILGFIFCSTHTWGEGQHLTIDHLIVHGSSRGKGIGTKLLERVEKAARAKGVLGIDLTTNVSGPDASFWKERSFRPAGYIQMTKDL